MTDEQKYWAVRCPNCKHWQVKEHDLFGRTTQNATCIYCGNKIALQANGKLFDQSTAQGLVIQNNSMGRENEGFGTFKPAGK